MAAVILFPFCLKTAARDQSECHQHATRVSALRDWRGRAAQSFEHLGRGDHLANVALRVIGDMDQRASGGGGQLLAADAAASLEVGFSESADSFGGVAE